MLSRNFCCLSLLTVLALAGEPDAQGYEPLIENATVVKATVRFDLYRDYLIVGHGAAGSVKGLNFLVDTGASPTVLDRHLAQKLGLEEEPASLVVVNGNLSAGRATVPILEFGPVRLDHLPVVIADLSFFQKAIPVRIDAIVGLDVLGQIPFEIDYVSREIHFGAVSLLANSLTLRIKEGLPVVDAELNHRAFHLLIDTGASSLILFQPTMTTPASAMNISATQPPSNGVGEFGNQKVWLSSLRLGETEFGREPTFLIRSPGGRNHDFDGMMSPTALGITKISIDLERGVAAFSRCGKTLSCLKE